MITTVNKWGNSLSIRIPRLFVKELALKEDCPVEMNMVDGAMVISPVKADVRSRIEQRFEEFSASGRIMEEEYDWGDPVGEEVW